MDTTRGNSTGTPTEHDDPVDVLGVRGFAALKPALERCAATMRACGLDASVSETRGDPPPPMGRRDGLVLRLQKSEGKGPGLLTITAVEGRDLLRVVMRIGPSAIGGGWRQHDGLVPVDSVTDDVVGGLVATLVEQVFG
jgi:hypothetical protein